MNKIVELPTGLKPTGDVYLAAFVQRQQQSDAQARVYLERNFAFNGSPPDSYLQMASMSRFAWQGVLTADFLAAAGTTAVTNPLPALPPEVPTSTPFPLVAGCQVQLNGPDIVLDEVFDFDALAGSLLVFVDDEIMSIAIADLTDAGAYSLTVVRGFFGTAVEDHLTGATLFIVLRADVIPFTHPSFQKASAPTFKIAIGVNDVADSDPITLSIPGITALVLTSAGVSDDSLAIYVNGVPIRDLNNNFASSPDPLTFDLVALAAAVGIVLKIGDVISMKVRDNFGVNRRLYTWSAEVTFWDAATNTFNGGTNSGVVGSDPGPYPLYYDNGSFTIARP